MDSERIAEINAACALKLMFRGEVEWAEVMKRLQSIAANFIPHLRQLAEKWDFAVRASWKKSKMSN